MSKKCIIDKIGYVLLYFTVMSILSGLLVVIFWQFYPYKTVEFSDFRISKVSKRPLDLGYIITASWDFDKYINAPAHYSVNIVPLQSANGLQTIYTSESGIVNTPVGHIKTSKSIKVSEEVPPGKYRIIAVLSYQVNPIRVIKKEFSTINFFEIPKK